MGTLVSYDLQDGIATITMDDGAVNVLSPAMQAELNGALDQAAEDEATVVLTGRPNRFSAGFDLAVLTAGGSAAADMLRGGFELSERLLSNATPVVIACNGHAIAMASFLLLSADARIGTAGPYKIVANEVAIGLTMPFTAIEICRQRLATPYFHRAVINAEVFDPESAVAAGFLDRVVPAEDLSEAARGTAAELAKLHPAAHATTKLRARAQALAAIRAAIEIDDTAVREFL
jgi:enoyl-CoA hydratase